VQDIFDRYGSLLREVDDWFTTNIESHSTKISCHRGCSACCRGLFDITLLDAFFLRIGFNQLEDSVQQEVRRQSLARLDQINKRWPAFKNPWLLNLIPEPEWEDIMPEDDDTPCVMLSQDGACLVYEHRPMTCRLNGIPLIDISGEELFDDWCTLNFTDCDPLLLEDLRYPFNDLFAQELLLFQAMTRHLFDETLSELDTLIPAAVCFDSELILGALPRDRHCIS